jgi:hypothetical protein
LKYENNDLKGKIKGIKREKDEELKKKYGEIKNHLYII